MLRRVCIPAALLLHECTSTALENAPALAHGLSYQGADSPPAFSVGAVERHIFVDCDIGSDESDGLSVTAALRTLPVAQRVARVARADARALSQLRDEPEATVVVQVLGNCHLHAPLVLSSADSGSSPDARTIWRGSGPGSVISAGMPISSWSQAQWPSAPAGSVLQTDVSGWPVPIKSLRVGDDWVQRSRFPKADPANYSAGWLTTAAWTPSTERGNITVLGLVDGAVPASALADVQNMYANVFGLGGEKDVLNQITRATAVTHGANGTAIKVPLQAGVQPLQRFFLENVKSALSEGEFYIDDAKGSLYVWPKPEWQTNPSEFVAVAPTGNTVFEIRGADFVTLSNITVRDSSYTSEGCWCGSAGEPNDAAVLIAKSNDVTVEACSFSAGVAGYAVAGTNGSLRLRVVGCRVANTGQGGVLLYGNTLNHTQPDYAFISHNHVQNIGQILKHVGGVGLHSGSHAVITHNRVHRSPRYGINIDQGMPESASMHNFVAFNVVSETCRETADCGALEFNGDGSGTAYEAIDFNLNNTLMYNNVTNTVGSGATDGVHVCQHGNNHNSGPSGLGCRNLTWGIYLDGSDGFSKDGKSGGSGYCGAKIYGNILSASMGGALYTAAGNDNFTNNIVIARDTQPGWGALSIGAVNNASTERRPGSRFNTNIFMIELPAGTNSASCGTDSKSPRPFPCPMVVGGDFYADLGETGAGTATRWAGSDNNLFWSPNGAPIRFTDDGLSLAEWQQQNRTVGGPPDQHSHIADPLFADPARGDYSLKPNSPALALGFVPIPQIHAPFLSAR